MKTKCYNEHPEVEISQIQDEFLDLDRPHAGTKMLLKHHTVLPILNLSYMEQSADAIQSFADEARNTTYR